MVNIFNSLQGEGSLAQLIGGWIHRLYMERSLLLMYLHIIISAIFPIYAGAHASLRCPPSAKVPEKSREGKIDYDDDLDKYSPEIQGLQPSDAILFPIMAGATLSGLYVLIKWLDDPRILSRILNWYFSGIGVLGVSNLTIDSLNVATSFIFPDEWSTKTEVFTYAPDSYRVKRPSESEQISSDLNIDVIYHRGPLPGILSSLHFSKSVTSGLRVARALFRDHLIFRGYIKNFMKTAKKIRLNDFIGFIFGFFVVFLYNFLANPWWLTNLIAFGFCYCTLQLLSPTTFWTGSLVLSGLFIYDITMVFYTPLMITVAKSLDVPIKLVFPGPKNDSMLGLGDVILPGIMVALALRFDLYLHYLKKQRSDAPTKASDKIAVIKPRYVESTGFWGERFWTSSLEPELLQYTIADGSRFKKRYFWASMTGYIAGLMITLFVLKIFNHAQPALLYLVPGVLLALWGTASISGDIKTMWNYTEDDGSVEIESKNKKDKNKTSSTQDSENNHSEKTEKGSSEINEIEAASTKHVKQQDLPIPKPIVLFSLGYPRAIVGKVQNSGDNPK